jgi:hypothetical protein
MTDVSQESHQPVNLPLCRLHLGARMLFNKANKVQPISGELVAPNRIFSKAGLFAPFSAVDTTR